jgi:hypothetical protein
MFPIAKDTLTFREISNYWAREIRPPASKAELLALLEQAWWLGEIRGLPETSRVQRLQAMFRGMRDWPDLGIVFIQGDKASTPEVTELPDGTVEVDQRVRVPVPNCEIDDWDEQICEPAFQALAQTSSSESYPLLTPGIASMQLTHEEFSEWCKMRGFKKPEFWRSPVTSSSLEKPKRGRPPEYNWSGVRERLTEYASTNGPVQKLDELLEKCGDFACELHPKNERPDDSTIRAAIEKHGLDTAARMVSGK